MLLDRGVDANTTTHGPIEVERATSSVPIAFRAQRSGNWAVFMLLQRRGVDEQTLRPHVLRLMRTNREWTDTVAEFHRRPEVRQEVRAKLAEWQAHRPQLRGHYTPIDLREFHDVAAATPPLSVVPPWAVLPVDLHSPAALLVGITHAFAPALVELLLTRGFDGRTARLLGRSLVAMAVRAGRRDVADLLGRHGAPDDVTPLDALIGACLRLDAHEAHAIARAYPHALETATAQDLDVLVAASRSSIDHLRLMLDVGVPAGGRGCAGMTALHAAAWHGRVDAVRLLMARGAPADARDLTFDATPREWAEHGAVHCRTAEDEYRAVREALSRLD
jgi:hypothetical protein